VQSTGGSVDHQLRLAGEAHKAKQTDIRDEKAKAALDMLLRMDTLMHLRPDRRLETWTNAARRWATRDDEAAFYDGNARRLITTWGWPELSDYASRVWSGLIRDYYVGRWSAYFQGLREGKPISLDIWQETWLSSPYKPSAPGNVTDLPAEARVMLDTCKKYEDMR